MVKLKSSINIEKLIKKVVKRHIDPEKTFVFLFGSRAAGQHRPASDYDIGLYTGKRIPLSTIAMIKDELENYPIPVDVDIIDFSATTKDFKNLAKKEIKIWNAPKKKSKPTLPF